MICLMYSPMLNSNVFYLELQADRIHTFRKGKIRFFSFSAEHLTGVSRTKLYPSFLCKDKRSVVTVLVSRLILVTEKCIFI